MFAGDGLPSHVCEDCIGQVNSFCDFKLMIEASDCSLRDFLRRQQERRCDQVRKVFLPTCGCYHIFAIAFDNLNCKIICMLYILGLKCINEPVLINFCI
jgi:hypothetical protein